MTRVCAEVAQAWHHVSLDAGRCQSRASQGLPPHRRREARTQCLGRLPSKGRRVRAASDALDRAVAHQAQPHQWILHTHARTHASHRFISIPRRNNGPTTLLQACIPVDEGEQMAGLLYVIYK